VLISNSYFIQNNNIFQIKINFEMKINKE